MPAKAEMVMAFSSICDKVKASDPQIAEAFVKAVEESENAPIDASLGREAKKASKVGTEHCCNRI